MSDSFEFLLAHFSRPVDRRRMVIPCPSCLAPVVISANQHGEDIRCAYCHTELSGAYLTVFGTWCSLAGEKGFLAERRPVFKGNFYWVPPEWVVYLAGLAMAGIAGNRADAVFMKLARTFLPGLVRHPAEVPGEEFLRRFYQHVGEFYWLRQSPASSNEYVDKILASLRNLETELAQGYVEADKDSIRKLLEHALQDIHVLQSTYASSDPNDTSGKHEG